MHIQLDMGMDETAIVAISHITNKYKNKIGKCII